MSPRLRAWFAPFRRPRWVLSRAMTWWATGCVVRTGIDLSWQAERALIGHSALLAVAAGVALWGVTLVVVFALWWAVQTVEPTRLPVRLDLPGGYLSFSYPITEAQAEEIKARFLAAQNERTRWLP